MADWTIIITTLGSAGVAGTVGWYGARKTAEVSGRSVAAENERLREQHREDHFRHRQAVYHDFLDVEGTMFRVITVAPAQGLDAHKLGGELAHAYNAVNLFGVQEVVSACDALVGWFREIARSTSGQGNPGIALRQAANARADEHGALLNMVITAMRHDVGHLPS